MSDHNKESATAAGGAGGIAGGASAAGAGGAAAAAGAGGGAAFLGGAVGSSVGLVAATPFAAAVTFGLFTVMQILITGDEFELGERSQAVDLQISSNKEDTQTRRRDQRPDEPEDVQAPPPPPQIETTKADQPEEGLAESLGRLPGINADEITSDAISFVVVDRDEQPIFRPVNYPRIAQQRNKEGTCRVTVDVAPDGSVTNPRADCTDSVFVRSVQRDALRWKYQPRVEEGEQVMRRNLVVEVEFSFGDE